MGPLRAPRIQPSTIHVKNPATGERIASIEQYSAREAAAARDLVRAFQPTWAEWPLEERVAVVRRYAKLLSNTGREVAALISAENGKTIQEAYELEILPIVYLATYYADHAEAILRPRRIPLHLFRHKWSEVEYRPRGVVYIISPWNFPFSIPTGEVLMALIAGNTVLHKPASLTPLIALRTQALLREAGLPADAYRVIPCSGSTAFSLVGPGVDYVNFTGSTEVGKRVSERCGETLIPCSMELGGKDPTIILDDANLERAANAVVWGAFANSGQVCASVERVYVPRAQLATFAEMVAVKTRALRQGDPTRSDVDVGAMTDAHQLEQVARQVDQALEKGARVLIGGRRPTGPGQFYPPTVLTDVTADMDIAREESFGPVLPLIAYDTVDEAIAQANDSHFGLTASVFGKDEKRARRVASRIQAGTVMLNEVLYTHGLAETPWSGVKSSGTGRVHSDEGLRDLCVPVHIHGNRLPTPNREIVWYPYSEGMLKVIESATAVLAEHGLRNRLRRLAQEVIAAAAAAAAATAIR